MLIGASIVLTFVSDRRDNRRLIVFPTVRGDSRTFADERLRPVSAYQQTSGYDLSISKCNIDGVTSIFKAGHRTATQVNAELLRFFHQGIHEVPVFNHVGKWFTLLYVTAESKKCRPHRII